MEQTPSLEKAVAGRNVLEKLENGDEIQRIEPMSDSNISPTSSRRLTLTSNLRWNGSPYLLPGNASRDASEGVEHFLALARTATIKWMQ